MTQSPMAPGRRPSSSAKRDRERALGVVHVEAAVSRRRARAWPTRSPPRAAPSGRSRARCPPGPAAPPAGRRRAPAAGRAPRAPRARRARRCGGPAGRRSGPSPSARRRRAGSATRVEHADHAVAVAQRDAQLGDHRRDRGEEVGIGGGVDELGRLAGAERAADDAGARGHAVVDLPVAAHGLAAQAAALLEVDARHEPGAREVLDDDGAGVAHRLGGGDRALEATPAGGRRPGGGRGSRARAARRRPGGRTASPGRSRPRRRAARRAPRAARRPRRRRGRRPRGRRRRWRAGRPGASRRGRRR